MSQQPPELPKEGDEPINGEGADQQKRKTLRAFAGVVWMRLVDFAGELKARCPSKEQCQQYYDSTKRFLRVAADRATPLARRIDIAQERALDGIATAIERIIVPPFKLFWRFFTYPEAVMALFTVILAVVTYYQWDVTERTLQEFTTQGKYAERQLKVAEGQLEETRKATEQTEKVIEQTRLEQRAWLSVNAPTIEALVVNQPIKYVLPVVNSGNTPAKIISGVVKLYILPVETDTKTIAADFEKGSPFVDMGTLVSPEGRTHLEVGKDAGILEPTWEADIKNGSKQVFIIGRFIYMDAFQVPHTTKFLFEHDFGTNRLLMEGTYGHLD